MCVCVCVTILSTGKFTTEKWEWTNFHSFNTSKYSSVGLLEIFDFDALCCDVMRLFGFHIVNNFYCLRYWCWIIFRKILATRLVLVYLVFEIAKAGAGAETAQATMAIEISAVIQVLKGRPTKNEIQHMKSNNSHLNQPLNCLCPTNVFFCPFSSR